MVEPRVGELLHASRDGLGRADDLRSGPARDLLGVGQLLPALERRGPGLVAPHARDVDVVGAIVLDLRLHVAGHELLGLVDRLAVRIGDDRVDEQRAQGRDAIERTGLPRARFPRRQQLGRERAEARADRGEPELGHHLRRRWRADRAEEVDLLATRRGAHAHGLLDPEVGALVGERRALHRAVEDLPSLAEALTRLGHRDAERVVLVLRRAAAEADVELLVGQVAEHRELAGEPQRVVPGRHEHAGAEREIGEARREVCHQDERARARVVVGEVVLDQPGGAEAERPMGRAAAGQTRVDLGVGHAGRVRGNGQEPEVDVHRREPGPATRAPSSNPA